MLRKSNFTNKKVSSEYTFERVGKYSGGNEDMYME